MLQSANYHKIVEDSVFKYESRGFDVQLNPRGAELPGFLEDYSPDLLATKHDGPRITEGFVVEVQAPEKKRRADYWKKLAQAVRQQQEWHLELVTGGTVPALFTTSEIQTRLDQSLKLASDGYTDAAFLLSWVAAEVAIRQYLARYDVEVKSQAPGAVVAAMQSEGFLDLEDYKLLAFCVEVRNHLVHGLKHDVQAKTIQSLVRFASNLLATKA